jgi:hypothetical protein
MVAPLHYFFVTVRLIKTMRELEENKINLFLKTILHIEIA